jgi:AsmA protein
MSKSVKRTLAVVAALVFLLLALRFFINADQFRPLLERELTAALGREVKIAKLSLFLLGAEVRADRITIAEAPGFGDAPFVSATGLQVGVELWPLITERQLVVKRIELVEPQVILIQGEDLRWNFSTLGGAKADAPASSDGGGGGRAAGMDLSVKRVVLSGGKLVLKLAGGRPDGIVIDEVEAEVQDVSTKSVMPIALSVALPAGGRFRLDGRAGPISAGSLTMTPLEAKFSIESLDLEKSGFVPASAAVRGIVTFGGTVSSKAGVATAAGKLTVNRLQVGANARPAPTPVELSYSMEHNLSTHAGSLKESTLRAGAATARLEGQHRLDPQGTLLAMSLTGKQMPVNEITALLPAFGVILPAGATLKGGTLSLNAKSTGSTSRLVSTGNVAVENSRVAGYSLSSGIATAAQLAGLQLGPDTPIAHFRANFQNSREMSRLDGIDLLVPGLGTVAGAVSMDSRQNLNGRLIAKVQVKGGLTGAAMQKVGGTGEGTLTVPVIVSGTAAAPNLSADTKALAADAAATAASKALEKYVPPSTASSVGTLVEGLLGGKKKK